jgi:protocatechuate 3,4-dioxygenase beta subunit
MPELTPTFGWLDIPNYRGWMPGEVFAGQMRFVSPDPHHDKLLLTGSVLSRSAAPLSGVVVEFFQADLVGKYNLADYQLRDRLRTKSDGRFMLETFLPGYADSIRHIHYIATARLPGRQQPLLLSAAIYFATDEELSRLVSDIDRPYVRPDAAYYRDDPAYLRLDDIPIRDGLRRVEYDIVFDVV